MNRIIEFQPPLQRRQSLITPQSKASIHSFPSNASIKTKSPLQHIQSPAPTTTMSSIPYDLLPSCDPSFAYMKLTQKQSFVNRFFGIRARADQKDSTLTALHSRNASRAFSSATPSPNTSYTSLTSTTSSSSSIRIPMAPPRRPRSNTATSSTSVASFVSQSSVRSQTPSRERAALDEGWTPVDEYF
ncbi:hypothetical protein P171DRAFT_431510 [Karstenula rhodostoma CBS 690.94]|uniref:Uncharacterized protein n=1 Tax=Karstenula rhodostoma CBS 690.94 TaxID=1392251 RepID=A0A9P4PIJ8_9PLEO|nr:hypothetical protein P171DRAFT_431510 [Karstenula rhodostoma CBS 690.94]